MFHNLHALPLNGEVDLLIIAPSIDERIIRLTDRFSCI